MSKRMTRRELFKGVGVAGATTLLAVGSGKAKPPADQLGQAAQDGELPARQLAEAVQHPEPTSLTSHAPIGPHENHLVELTAGDMIVAFDRRYGSISSITKKGDPLATNFIGNEKNTPGVDVSNSRWTGDLVTHVWEVNDTNPAHRNWSPRSNFVLKGKWRSELTGRSGDIRRVSFDAETFAVNYEGTSKNEDAIRSFSLAMKYRRGEGHSLLWDVELRNVTDQILELGDLGFPLMVNDDLGEFYRDPKTGQPFPPDETEHPLRDPADSFSVYLEQYPRIQKQYHEQKVVAHHYIGGHSSYVLIQRPLGNAPFLLLQAMQDTAFECVYRDGSSFGEKVYWWDGPNILAIHSWATKNLRKWDKNPWVNGHTSLVLQPGEKWSCQLRFAFVESYDAIREQLCKAGNLGIRVLPSMVVQENTDAFVELKSKSDVEKIDFLSENITVKEKKRVDDKTLLTLSFKGRGQKSLKLHYGDRWTNLHFYCIEDIAQLLKARGRFIVEREFYENPEDPYHRHHMFLPFDHRIGSTFLDSDEVSEVGGSDAEFGFSEPLFLAEKNVYYPSPKEVATLETYVADCLFKYIQNPETYAVRASLYWKGRYPSSPWSHWTVERAEATYRSYNYAHVMNIYHAMYRIGRRYGLLTRKSPEEYLRMSYRTCLQMFQTEPWGHVGVMGGSNALNLLEDLGKEGWQKEYSNLLEQIRKCNEVFLNDPYPYASEYPADTTAQEQVYFFTRYFGNTEKNLKTLQIIKALRGGNQPVWFQYGNDNKGDLTCWYTESTNGWALLQGFEDTGDLDTLIKGYAGVMSVEVNLLPDGMCFAHFISTPGIFDFTPPRTLDGGIAQFGFLKAAKSYVIQDDSFGLIGIGCRVESSEKEIRVYPQDGLKKRLRFVPHKIDLEAAQGEVDQVALSDAGKRLELHLSDSTGVVKRAELELKGLAKGDYLVRYGRTADRMQVSDTLELSIPIAHAKQVRVERVY
jgi:hypothetical protein